MTFFESKMAQFSHQPERTCVGCFRKFPQDQFLAVTKLKNGVIKIDFEQKLSGRSVYLCKNQACFLRATKRKGKNALAFGLKTEIPTEVFLTLEKFFSDRHLQSDSQISSKAVD